MAITVAQVFSRVNYLLNDTTDTRWTAAEKLLWLNDGRREMAALKPGVFGAGSEVTHTSTSGARQRITATGAYRLASVDYNVASGAALRVTTRQQLDAFAPDWRALVDTDAENYFTDETDPLAFWICPSVGVGAQIKCHVHITPTDLVNTSDVALPYDQFEPPLVNYILFRAFSKEDEAGAEQKAAAYLQLFQSAFKE